MQLEKMCIHVSNAKLSAKIPEISLDEIRKKCVEQNIKYVMYNNFIVVRTSDFTYIIFKKRLLKNSDKSLKLKQHANITVRNIEEIDNAINLLRKILQYDESIEIPFKIDNLTGTASLGKPIDLIISYITQENLLIELHLTLNDFLQYSSDIKTEKFFYSEVGN